MKITEHHRAFLQEDLATTKYKGVTRFMVANRQTGSTTALVEAAIAADGYLIVGNLQIAKNVKKKHPDLNPAHILTIQQVRNGSWNFDPCPVFIDATAIWGME